MRDIAADRSSPKQACLVLGKLNELSYNNMSSSRVSATCWRRMYTDTCIFRTLADLLDPSALPSEDVVRAGVARLDRAIIISGPCGEGRLDLILELIRETQTEFLSNVPLPTFLSPRPNKFQAPATRLPKVRAIPRLADPPSFSAFIARHPYEPFVLPGFGRDWPALQEHPWKSWEYLHSVAGPGRIVPVEIGNDYREDDWSQKMMDFDDFLVAISNADSHPGKPTLYLAQHNLLAQFPELREDILVPDYVYSDLAPQDDYPQYKPPGNEDQLVLSAWLGPRGTTSPAHTVCPCVTSVRLITQPEMSRILSITSLVCHHTLLSLLRFPHVFCSTGGWTENCMVGTTERYPCHVSLPSSRYASL